MLSPGAKHLPMSGIGRNVSAYGQIPGPLFPSKRFAEEVESQCRVRPKDCRRQSQFRSARRLPN